MAPILNAPLFWSVDVARLWPCWFTPWNATPISVSSQGRNSSQQFQNCVAPLCPCCASLKFLSPKLWEPILSPSYGCPSSPQAMGAPLLPKLWGPLLSPKLWVPLFSPIYGCPSSPQAMGAPLLPIYGSPYSPQAMGAPLLPKPWVPLFSPSYASLYPSSPPSYASLKLTYASPYSASLKSPLAPLLLRNHNLRLLRSYLPASFTSYTSLNTDFYQLVFRLQPFSKSTSPPPCLKVSVLTRKHVAKTV